MLLKDTLSESSAD